MEYSHEIYGEGFYQFLIEAPRLSDSSDVISVTISERLISKEMIKPGTIAVIEGQFRSYNNYSDSANKLLLTVFAREIMILEDESKIKNPNKIYLNGYICKKPIYRSTPFGREITDLLLAVNRAYNKSDYIPCIAWGRNSRFCSSLKIGDNIKVWGRIQSRRYQKKYGDGNIVEKTAYEVSVSKLEHVNEKEIKNRLIMNTNPQNMNSLGGTYGINITNITNSASDVSSVSGFSSANSENSQKQIE
jgi:single-stranded DNA-binding protein